MAEDRPRPSEQPPAIGYIRVDEPVTGEVAELLRIVATCCLRENLRLVRTFCDQGYDGTQLARPGIVEVRQALKDTAGLAVVVPAREHLSPSESIRGPLLLMVHRLGGRLFVACEGDGAS